MGTIVYSNLVELLLEEGDKTKEEIIKEGISRFDFPDNHKISFEVTLQLEIRERIGMLSKDKNEKYHLLKKLESNRKNFLEVLRGSSEHYLERLPYMRKLKTALEEAELRK